jgi:hypothetical protein
MSEFAQIPSFPRNLSYSLKVLEGSIIKTRIKINADLSSYNPGSIANFYVPPSRMIDNRSIVVYAKATTTTGTNKGLKLPRNGLHSLIEQLQITANSRILQSTSYYNFCYNLISDATGYGSIDQYSKRNVADIYDPSIRMSSHTAYNGTDNTANATAYSVANNTADQTNDENIYLCANNFLGFLSSSSVSTYDLNNIGQLKISFTWAPVEACWTTKNATAASTPYSYKLEEVFMTMDTITFSNKLYFDLVKEQLQEDGLKIAYREYVVQPLNSVDRSGGNLNLSTQVNASSLDMVMATFRPSTYGTIGELILGSQDVNTKTFTEIMANIPANSGKGGLYNNSAYYLRDGAGFESGSWYIQSSPFTQNASAPEVWNNTLQAFGYENLSDAGAFHPGCYNLNRFCRQYFVDALSLENISNDPTYFVSGIGGDGASINIQYNCKFKTTATDTSLAAKLIPYIIAVKSNILTIKIGRSLDLRE